MPRLFKTPIKSIDEIHRKDDVISIIEAAMAAVDPKLSVINNVKLDGDTLVAGDTRYDLAAINRIRVVGIGKASLPMAEALLDLLKDRIECGILVTKQHDLPTTSHLDPLEVVFAGHPIPDSKSIEAAARILRLAAELGDGDLLITLITGGASSLMTLPAARITLADLQSTTDVLLKSGASIEELNVVRKHLCSIKGGQLAQVTAPARTISLILSDVVGDQVGVIGSGPTAPDDSTFADAVDILKRHDLMDAVPNKIKERLFGGRYGLIEETPGSDDPVFNLTNNLIVGSNRLAAEAAVRSAREKGFNALLLTTQMEGEAKEVGENAARLLREIVEKGEPVTKPACVVLGGETTVTVRGTGKGGRNQELALSASVGLDGLEDVLVVALATDGGDGIPDCSGAVATGKTILRAKELGLNAQSHLKNNDAYHFFAPLGDLLVTGPTQTNVADLLFIFAL